MKTLFKITTILFLCIQSIGFSQTKDLETTSEKQEVTTQITDADLEKFIGKFLLVKGDFELEIVREENKVFIISPFSKDVLTTKNKTTFVSLLEVSI